MENIVHVCLHFDDVLTGNILSCLVEQIVIMFYPNVILTKLTIFIRSTDILG